MRRFRDRRQAGLFRGSELPRLMSMIVMLFVLAMMFRRASDRDTWRFFTGEPADLDQSAAADTVPRKPRVQPRRAAPPAGSVVVAAPEADAELALAFGPAAPADPAPDKAPSAASAVATDSAPAAAPAESKPAASSATAEAKSDSTEPQPETAESKAEAVEPKSGATEPESAPATGLPAAQGESETAVKDESAAPAEPSGAPRRAPIFRPHLPANPETYLDPEKEPQKPDIEPAPLDEDEQERREFEHECEAISDRTPLGKEEMFAYWRLLRWAQSQDTQQMLKRARSGVRYGDLLERPQDYRGDLLKVNLHIRRVRREDAPPDIPVEIQHYYEAIGWNDASQAWFYACIFVDLPEGMPIGDIVYEEGTFVGYFLKTFVYLDGKGTKIKAPILIGRMIYHPTPVLERNKDEWIWSCALGGVMVLLFLLRWGWRWRGKANAAPQIKGLLRRDGLSAEEGEGLEIEDWLAQAESQTGPTEIKSAADHDLNGSTPGDSLPSGRDHGLDWTEDRER